MKPLLTAILLLPLAGFADAAPSGFITLTADQHELMITGDKGTFRPWGFNYDRDFKMRLLEDYWDKEWATVEQDFREMKDLGANVVRIHLQFAKFMDAPDKPNKAALAQLTRLVRFAEQTGLYLDLTGLACYRKQDVPAWFDALPEAKRWEAQANFWQAIAQTCADSKGVFCYNLINEPIAPGDKQPDKQWLHPNSLAGFYYVQFIALDPAGRDRSAIAQQWTKQMIATIRKHDQTHLITIGLLPFPSGFDPKLLIADLDFTSVHLYPERNKLAEADTTLRSFRVGGRPLVLEEVFPLNIDPVELQAFIPRIAGTASGCISFYWGRTVEQLHDSHETADQITEEWLQIFSQMSPNRRGNPTTTP